MSASAPRSIGSIGILYEDARLVVLDKPTGLLSVPGIGPEKADCLASRVAAEVDGARIVHRLDRDTSGVIVMARDAEAHRHLSIQFQERQTTKVYVAVVDGVIAEDSGTIDLPMRKDLDDPRASALIRCRASRRSRIGRWSNAAPIGHGWSCARRRVDRINFDCI